MYKEMMEDRKKSPTFESIPVNKTNGAVVKKNKSKDCIIILLHFGADDFELHIFHLRLL